MLECTFSVESMMTRLSVELKERDGSGQLLGNANGFGKHYTMYAWCVGAQQCKLRKIDLLLPILSGTSMLPTIECYKRAAHIANSRFT